MLIDELDRVRDESAKYWSAFSPTEFFAKLGEAWSPAENVRHLAKSTRAVTKGLTMPRLVLRLMFGTTRRASHSYDEVRARYLALPTREAGAYAPSSRAVTDQTTCIRHLEDADRDLAAALARWSDRDLDRYQLPHPLLGKLTVREMVLFTVYHHRHHIEGVERRRRG